MNSRYEIVATATGEGGFGKVDKAQDKVLERCVAIKTLDPLFKTNPSNEDIERFRREAKTLARLSHPNIPAIYDVQFSEADKIFKIIFEWIEGISGRESLKVGVWSLDDVKRWFGNICSALEHAHSKGIIHRDIKPSNLIITENKESCYLVDFGIALRNIDIERLSHTPPGTPGYMSPEQEQGEDLDSASDIYALGIVLYEFMSGSRPRVGEYIPLNSLNEAIPPAVDSLVQLCLQDRQKRMQSSRVFYETLLNALRPGANLSTILTDGALYDVQAALSLMDVSEYSMLPSGQKRLIYSRLKDLVNVDKPRLKNAVVSLLSQFVRLAHQDNAKHYEFICQHALRYAYQVEYSDKWVGNEQLQKDLNDVAKYCTSEGHKVISKVLVEFLDAFGNELLQQDKWFYHGVRILLQNLLANCHCKNEDAELIGDKLDLVNEFSHLPIGGSTYIS
ncbi:MAG: protein kinase [Smithella sp.]